MKRLLLSGAFVALALGAMAESLTPQQALSRVYSDANSLGLRYAPAASARLVDTAVLNGITTYYVFSGENQTMIVSADDVAAPLLGTFDSAVTDMNSIPDNMKWWLSEYSRRIAWAVEQGVQSPNRLKVAIKESNAREANYQNVSPMVKTTWDQGKPYYNMCPRINNKPTYTGCVATAMAQVMYYHKWPQGAGSGSATIEVNGTSYSMDFSQTTFDWDNMLLSYSGSSTSTQQDAVALLMKACGYSVDMSYGTDASGAMSSDLVGALIDNFGYDKGITYDHRDLYSYDQWVDLLYTEMAAGRPVLYGGQGNSGGHQFVFDGFRASDKAFHVNWGWSGLYDGYFLVDALDPEGEGIGGNGGEGFSSSQDAVMGIQKPVSGSVAAEPYVMYYNGSTLHANLSGTTIQFYIDSQTGYFANMSGRDFSSVTFGTKVVNAETNAVVGTYASASVVNKVFASGSGYRAYSVEGLPSITDGTYDFYTVYRSGNGDWKEMRSPYGYYNFVRFEFENGEAETVSAYPEFWAVAYDGPTSAEAGTSITYTFTIESQESTDGALFLTPYLCHYNNGWYIDAELGGAQMVELAAGKSKDVTFTGTIDSSISSGTYYIFLVTPDMYIINDEDCMPELTVTGGTDVAVTKITYSKGFTPNQSYRVNVTLQNTGTKSVTMQLLGYLFSSDGSSIVASLGSSSAKAIAAGKSSTFYISGTLASDIAAGDYLFVVADASTYDILAYDAVSVSGGAAINDVAADGADVNAEYFDLSGRKVSGDAKGFVIRRAEGQKALKMAR